MLEQQHVVRLMLDHYSFTEITVLNDIGGYIDNDSLSRETEWGVIACKELLRVGGAFSKYVSIWEFRFTNKLSFQKYKLLYPEKYQELRVYVQQFENRYEEIANEPTVENIELAIRDPKDDVIRFLDEGGL